MSKTVKKVKQTCTCKNCGNEAEMIITCTLEDIHEHPEKTLSRESENLETPKQHVKGLGTCTHCGGESDIWVDI